MPPPPCFAWSPSPVPLRDTWEDVPQSSLLIALRLVTAGQWHEGYDLAAENIRPRNRDGAVGAGRLDHFENVLRAGRPDWDDHDAARLQLLQQGRRDVIDAAGDDDLIEGRVFLPAVITVGLLRRDRGIFAIALRDQPVIDAAGAVRELRDDLDRPDPVGQVAQQGRLEARARADLEHLVAGLDGDGAGHAAHRAGGRNRHAEADIDIMADIGLILILGQHEFFARRHQEGAFVGG